MQETKLQQFAYEKGGFSVNPELAKVEEFALYRKEYSVYSGIFK